jgi:hypothetical protein
MTCNTWQTSGLPRVLFIGRVLFLDSDCFSGVCIRYQSRQLGSIFIRFSFSRLFPPLFYHFLTVNIFSFYNTTMTTMSTLTDNNNGPTCQGRQFICDPQAGDPGGMIFPVFLYINKNSANDYLEPLRLYDTIAPRRQ